MPKVVPILILLLCCQWLSAQDEPAKIYVIPDEYAQLHHKGEQALLSHHFKEALSQFKKVLKKFPDFAPALRSTGACYEMMGDMDQAKLFYEKALALNPNFSRALYFECGKANYQLGEYRKALQYFQQFDSLKLVSPTSFGYNGQEELAIEKNYYQQLSANIRACNVAMDSIQFWNIGSVENLGSSINSEADEYFPFLTNDGNTLLYTSRKNGLSNENLFISTRPQGDWRIGKPITNFNTEENEGMVSMVKDGRRLFFTACHRPEVLGPCDIWEAQFHNGEVKEAKPSVGYANSGGWESQACISCDGSLLLFASNREGGYGGADIWKSERQADGRWGEPVNLGPNINTMGDEEAPFITNDGNVVYFSSTGHLGLGEQDIFMSRRLPDGTWGFAVNLGMPVNSSYRELGFFLTADGKTGYFASNRKGGQGGMDIYHFTLPDQLSSEPITYVEGYLKDSITHLPIESVVYFKNRQPVKTDKEGRFFLCIHAGDTLRTEVRADDYHPYKNSFIIPKWDNRSFYHLNLLLDPLFRLPVFQGELATNTQLTAKSPPAPGSELRHQVLFQFDDAEMKVQEIEKLTEFLENSIIGNSVKNVEVIGFADDMGTDSYNLLLSEKRAKSVGVFLKNKGIRVDKIFIEGKGESNNERPKWQNRRVEIVVYMK